MYTQETATTIRIVSITSTTTAQPLAKLVNDVMASKTQELPPGCVLKVTLTPAAAVEIRDIKTNDVLPLTEDIAKTFEVKDALNQLTIKNDATVILEIYFGR